MKNILFYIIITFISYNCFGQNVFKKLIDLDYAQRPTSIIIDTAGNYIISSQEFIEDKYNSYILKLSKNGSFIDSVYTYNKVVSDIIKIDSNFFISLELIYSNSITKNKLSFSKYDNNLNLFSNYNFETNYKITKLNYFVNSSNNIMLFGTKLTQNNIYKSFIYKLNNDFCIIDSFIYNYNGALTTINNILEKKDKKGYFIFLTAPDKIISLDNKFNILSISQNMPLYNNSPFISSFNTNTFWFNDSLYIISGLKNNSNTENDLAILISDTNYICTKVFCSEISTYDQPALNVNLSFKTKRNIYQVGTKNFSINPFETEPSWIIINNFNENLELNWQRTIGGSAYYCATNVIATDDGGCFIAATQSDSYNDFDMYFLKIDSLGSITHINGEIQENISNHQIFPNPFSDFINLELFDNQYKADFYLYNSLGQIVLQNKIVEQSTFFDLSFLQSGIYMYKLVFENYKIEQGKIIKK